MKSNIGSVTSCFLSIIIGLKALIVA